MPCRISKRDQTGRLHIWLHGEVDEDFCVTELGPLLKGQIVMHLGEVTAINSCGVREWISLMGRVPDHAQLEFVECSVPLTRQFGMLSNFRGPGGVISFFAPYYCEECDAEVDKLLVVGQDVPAGAVVNSPEFDCEQCGTPLEFDSLERVYFSFLREIHAA